MRQVLAWMLTLAIVFGSYQVSAEVSPEQFREESEAHRQRVCRDMLYGYKYFNQEMPHINSNMIQLWCSGHDLPKVMTLPELKVYHYVGKEDVATILSRYHGVRFIELPEKERRKAFATMEQLNRVEETIQQESALEIKRGYPSHDLNMALYELTELESWVDALDVSLNREDIPTSNYSGEAIEYLESKGRLSDLGRRILQYLEGTHCDRQFLPRH